MLETASLFLQIVRLKRLLAQAVLILVIELRISNYKSVTNTYDSDVIDQPLVGNL
ncbi:hypothetical protein BSAF29S_01819 [Bacillus safensis subsp. safensis]